METMEWVDVAAVAELGDEPLGVTVGTRAVALYRVEGEVYATDSQCTHGNANLCDGYLEGHEIECPLHQGRFDVRTGRALCAPLTLDLRTHPVKILDGRIAVALAR